MGVEVGVGAERVATQGVKAVSPAQQSDETNYSSVTDIFKEPISSNIRKISEQTNELSGRTKQPTLSEAKSLFEKVKLQFKALSSEHLKALFKFHNLVQDIGLRAEGSAAVKAQTNIDESNIKTTTIKNGLKSVYKEFNRPWYASFIRDSRENVLKTAYAYVQAENRLKPFSKGGEKGEELPDLGLESLSKLTDELNQIDRRAWYRFGDSSGDTRRVAALQAKIEAQITAYETITAENDCTAGDANLANKHIGQLKKLQNQLKNYSGSVEYRRAKIDYDDDNSKMVSINELEKQMRSGETLSIDSPEIRNRIARLQGLVNDGEQKFLKDIERLEKLNRPPNMEVVEEEESFWNKLRRRFSRKKVEKSKSENIGFF